MGFHVTLLTHIEILLASRQATNVESEVYDLRITVQIKLLVQNKI